MALEKLKTVLTDVAAAFPEGDELVDRFSEAYTKTYNKTRASLISRLEGGNGPRNLSDLLSFTSDCNSVLLPTDDIFEILESKIAERNKNHRDKLHDEIFNSADLSVRRITQLERACYAELPSDDVLFEELKRCKVSREPVVKRLQQQFSLLMKKKLKDVDLKTLKGLLETCEKELDNEDSLVAQVRSACEAKVSTKKSKSIKKKSSEDSSKKDKNMDVVLNIFQPDEHFSSNKKGISNIVNDIPGLDHASIKIRLLSLLFVALFGFIMFSSVQLVLEVAPLSGDATANEIEVPIEEAEIMDSSADSEPQDMADGD